MINRHENYFTKNTSCKLVSTFSFFFTIAINIFSAVIKLIMYNKIKRGDVDLSHLGSAERILNAGLVGDNFSLFTGFVFSYDK